MSPILKKMNDLKRFRYQSFQGNKSIGREVPGTFQGSTDTPIKVGRIKKFAAGTHDLDYETYKGDGNKAPASQTDTGPIGPMIYWKKDGESIGGPLLPNLILPDPDQSKDYCVMCIGYEVRYKFDKVNTFLQGGSSTVNAIVDALPVVGDAKNYAEYAENLISAIDGLNNRVNTLADSKKMGIRGIICADGKTAMTYLNVPKIKRPDAVVQKIGKNFTSTTKFYGVSPEGKTGKNSGVEGPIYHEEN